MSRDKDELAAAFQAVSARSIEYVSCRFRLNLRLAVRLTCAVSLPGIRWPAHQGTVVAAAVLCAAYDVALFMLLRRGARVPHMLRLTLDVLDTAAWCVMLGGSVEPAALIASPSGLEVALRKGARAVAVPVVVGTAAAVTMHAAGEAVSAAPFALPALGVLGGLLIRRYRAGRLRERLWEAAAERQAAAGRAELAGQHSVAVGADTAVDVLTRTWPLLAVPGRSSAFPLAAWRQGLAERAAGHAEYLGTALLRWEREHNSGHPELRRDVDFEIEGAAGATLLSPGQVTALGEALTLLGPSGRVPVRVPDAAPLGHRQELSVGPHRVELAADPRPRTPPFDPGPLVIALGGIGGLTQAGGDMDGVPLPVAAAVTALALLTAWWAHRLVTRRGLAARPRVLAACLTVGAADAVVSTLTMTNVAAAGLTRQPYLYFLLFSGPLAIMYLRDLTRPQRLATAAAMAGIVGGAAMLLPRAPVRRRRRRGGAVAPGVHPGGLRSA
ncbi:hypothetical protein Msi02_79890 [Microbispora siamensis]|uniref:Fusaric acid resistance protein-like n=1 Tax=Microbispora siamensis TaxID=564413 RepID=A0ABQ4H0H9_9ACTN|nr:hypothetical protein Msi02_79890 [Microbispora siamensis]